MPRKLRTWILAIGASAPSALLAQGSGCYPSVSDTPALQLLSYSRYIAAATDSVSNVSRADLGLPLLDSTKVSLTLDARTCTNIVAGINTFLNTPNAIRRLQVAQLVKSGFMASDGTTPGPATSFVRPVYFLTTRYVVKTVLLGL